MSIALTRAYMVFEVSFYAVEKLENGMVTLQSTLMHTERNIQIEFVITVNTVSQDHTNDKCRTRGSEEFLIHVWV
jgi:hypothetical protein